MCVRGLIEEIVSRALKGGLQSDRRREGGLAHSLAGCVKGQPGVRDLSGLEKAKAAFLGQEISHSLTNAFYRPVDSLLLIGEHSQCLLILSASSSPLSLLVMVMLLLSTPTDLVIWPTAHHRGDIALAKIH